MGRPPASAPVVPAVQGSTLEGVLGLVGPAVEDRVLGQDIPLGCRAIALLVAGLGAYHEAGAVRIGYDRGCAVVSAPQQEGIWRVGREPSGYVEVVPTHAREGIDPVEEDGHAVEAGGP